MPHAIRTMPMEAMRPAAGLEPRMPKPSSGEWVISQQFVIDTSPG
jgi:hypothetical protein